MTKHPPVNSYRLNLLSSVLALIILLHHALIAADNASTDTKAATPTNAAAEKNKSKGKETKLTPEMIREAKEKEAAQYTVIRMDPPQANADVICTENRGCHPANSGIKDTRSRAPAGWIRVYSFGRPLQVERSYAENRQEQSAPLIRSALDNERPHRPEAFTYFRPSVSQSETIFRQTTGFLLPVTEQFDLALRMRNETYELDEDDQTLRGDLNQIELAGIYRFNQEISLTGGLTGYGTSDLYSPGLFAQAIYGNRGGVSFGINGNLWTPWTDNTISVREWGRRSGLELTSSLPLAERLQLSLSGAANWFYTAADTFSIDSHEGWQMQGGARLDWIVWKHNRRQLPVSFLNPESLSQEYLSSELRLYGSLLASQYFDRPFEPVIPVTESQLDQRLGLESTFAFTPKLGGRLAGYLGYDPERDIPFCSLWGASSQLVYIPLPGMRIYGEFSVDNEAATGIDEGKTWSGAVGMNLRF